MKERALTVSGPEAVALRGGEQTQIRRVVRGNHAVIVGDMLGQPKWYVDADPSKAIRCPLGAVGDRLWLRETWARMSESRLTRIAYRADMTIQNQTLHRGKRDLCPWPVDDSGRRGHSVATWWQARTMPRWASRTLLDVTGVRVERGSDVTEADARAMGFTGDVSLRPRGWDETGDDWNAGTTANYIASYGDPATPIGHFRHTWDLQNKRAPWASWVWVVNVKRVTP